MPLKPRPASPIKLQSDGVLSSTVVVPEEKSIIEMKTSETVATEVQELQFISVSSESISNDEANTGIGNRKLNLVLKSYKLNSYPDDIENFGEYWRTIIFLLFVMLK